MSIKINNVVPFLFCGIAGIALGSFFINKVSQAGRAIAHIEPRVLNLGTIIEGSQVTTTVRVVNTSNAPLHVSQIVTSCGCTSTDKLSVIPAHGFVPLTVTFDSEGRAGAIEKQVSIFTKEKPDAPLMFPLLGTVKTEWQVSPSASLDLGDIAGGDTKTVTVQVSRASGKPVSFSSSPVIKGIKATFSPTSNGKTATVRVVVTATRLPGERQEIVSLMPTDATLPPVRLQLSYTAKGRFTVSPDTLNFGVVEKHGKPTELVSTVSDASGMNPALRLVSAPKGIAVRIESAPNGKSLLIRNTFA